MYFRTPTFSLEINQSVTCLDLFVYIRKINEITQIETGKTKQNKKARVDFTFVRRFVIAQRPLLLGGAINIAGS